MNEIRKTTQFKKDFKRIKHDLKKVEALFRIVEKLAKGEDIPKEYNPHHLVGDYKKFMECHIEDDLLLIWFDKLKGVIELTRLGTHSELYGKGKKR